MNAAVIVKESTMSHETALYYQTLERLKQKEAECEELFDKLLLEQEKTDSFKKSLSQIVHNKVLTTAKAVSGSVYIICWHQDVAKKRIQETESLITILEKKLPTYQAKIDEEIYKQVSFNYFK